MNSFSPSSSSFSECSNDMDIIARMNAIGASIGVHVMSIPPPPAPPSALNNQQFRPAMENFFDSCTIKFDGDIRSTAPMKAHLATSLAPNRIRSTCTRRISRSTVAVMKAASSSRVGNGHRSTRITEHRVYFPFGTSKKRTSTMMQTIQHVVPHDRYSDEQLDDDEDDDGSVADDESDSSIENDDDSAEFESEEENREHETSDDDNNNDCAVDEQCKVHHSVIRLRVQNKRIRVMHAIV